MAGFIKIDRRILKWGWYSDPATKDVFFHLLLTANYKPGEYKGVKIMPGQAVFGRVSCANALGLSEQQVRTAIKHLEKTGEISIKSTNKFSVVTIENWALYQSDSASLTNNQPSTNHQLTNNQPSTNHIQERKKERKKEINDALAGDCGKVIPLQEQCTEEPSDEATPEQREYFINMMLERLKARDG